MLNNFKHKGMALILVLFLTLIFVLLSFSYIYVVIIESGSSRLSYNADAALQVTKAGINYAIYCMGQRSKWIAGGNTGIPSKNGTISLVDVADASLNPKLNGNILKDSFNYPIPIMTGLTGEWTKLEIKALPSPVDPGQIGFATLWQITCKGVVKRGTSVIAERELTVILGERSTSFCIVEKNVRSWDLNNAPAPNPADGTDDCIGFTGNVNITGSLKVDGNLKPVPGNHDGGPTTNNAEIEKWGDINLWKTDGTAATVADHPTFQSFLMTNSPNTHGAETFCFPQGLRAGSPSIGLGGNQFDTIRTTPNNVFRITDLYPNLPPVVDTEHPDYSAINPTNPCVSPIVKVTLINNGTQAKINVVYRYAKALGDVTVPGTAEHVIDLGQSAGKYNVIYTAGTNVEITGGTLGNAGTPYYLTIACESVNHDAAWWTGKGFTAPTADETPRTGNIFISGNITYGNTSSSLGILAENYIFLNDRNVDKNLEVSAVLKSVNRSVQFDWFNEMRKSSVEGFNNTGELDLRGKFTLKGSIISKWADVEGTVYKVGDRQGYCDQQITYDERLRNNYPPFMARDPGASDAVNFLDFNIKALFDKASL